MGEPKEEAEGSFDGQGHGLHEEAWSLYLRGRREGEKSEEALRRAIAIVERDHFHLGAVSLLVRMMIDFSHRDLAAQAAAKLGDAFIRRGDLPGAASAAILIDRAGHDGGDLRKAIAQAFGKGSERLADTAPAPPALPSRVRLEEFESLSGEALEERAKAALRAFIESSDAHPHGKVPRLPLFSELHPRALLAFLEAIDMADVDAGEAVITQGSVGHEAFVVVRGTLSAQRIEPVKEEKAVLALLGPGAIFGEMALVSSAPRAAWVIAEEPSTILVVPKEALEAAAEKEPVIARELASYCHARMIANLIRTSPILRAVPLEERESLFALFEPRTFDRGEVIVAQGSEPPGLYLIASGAVRVSTVDPSDGEDIVIADLGPGDVFGEISVVLRQPATATVCAIFPTVAFELSRDRFREVIRKYPALLAELYELATSRAEELRSVVAQEAAQVDDIVLL
ncbi:MAG: cyclic nucleotide-binding domain-containing protein [Sandaracinaceae bacterium]|nr:cyclic nucleotide-binding domain-containing protein [Sandaracinaceae bacterium]